DTINYHRYASPFDQKNCSSWEYNNWGNDTLAIPNGMLLMQNAMILPMEDVFYCLYTTYDYCTKDIFKLSFTSFHIDGHYTPGIFIKDSTLLEGDLAENVYAVRHGNGRD